MSSMPIYRAKEINSNEYVEGYYVEGDMFNDYNHYIVDCYRSQVDNGCVIDSTTLAIHFPNMLDSERNRIFASLSEEGKGGDITLLDDNLGNIREGVFLWNSYAMTIDIMITKVIKDNFRFQGVYPAQYGDFTKVIGIQE